MHHALTAALLAAALFGGILLFLEIGWRIGARRAAKGGSGSGGLGTVDAAVFGLLGLLIAFTFSGAAARFDARRHLIVEEANDIGTAYLRLDLLPASTQPALRESFRRYLDSRLAVYRKLPDVAAARRELAESARLQQEIWTETVSACRAADSPAVASLVLSALNAMIDITTTRTHAAQMHPPTSIFAMLFGLSLAGGLLVGYALGANNTRSWLHRCAFAAIMALAVYVILDLEYPRLGLIRLDRSDQVLVDLRESMK